MLSKVWQRRIEVVDFAFQPIISPFSGANFAVEALLRNFEEAGFESIFELFDTAHNEGVLFDVDLELRKKAIRKFKKIKKWKKLKLFYNYDVRIPASPTFKKGATGPILDDFNIDPAMFCFEISERHNYEAEGQIDNIFENTRTSGCRIALDDFGAGFANFELFYHSEPDYIKLDRFLVQDIHKDIRKKKYCTSLINLAHFFGITIIAEGVETKKEFLAVKEIGADLVQGYYVQKPTQNVEELENIYGHILYVIQKDKRLTPEDSYLISNEIKKLEVVSVNDMAYEVLEKMHKNSEVGIVPVVDPNNVPIGIISERTLKKYLYLPYGKELLANKSLTSGLKEFINNCPVSDINTKLEQVLEIFVGNESSEGIIITKDLKYEGFMTAQSLLSTLNEKNLAFARDMNPLTKLPGNNLINDYINSNISIGGEYRYLVYFDFDNFKPFNDRFGFRQGDRAITLFSDLIRKELAAKGFFIGHVGGDDFFSGISMGMDSEGMVGECVSELQRKFSESVLSFYSSEEVMQGYYIAKDRSGEKLKFDFLTVSAAIICIPSSYTTTNPDDLSEFLARLKKEAKASSDKIAFECVGESCRKQALIKEEEINLNQS